MQPNFAVVWLIDPGQEPKERGLADAVRPDQADAVAGVQLEADFAKQRPFIESAGQTATA